MNKWFGMAFSLSTVSAGIPALKNSSIFIGNHLGDSYKIANDFISFDMRIDIVIFTVNVEILHN